jgi:MFS family permease
MLAAVKERLRESVRAFRGAFGNKQLRKLQLGGAGDVMGQWAYGVSLAVFAYQEGGAQAVGLVALIRTIPAAAAAPFASGLADRFPRVVVMTLANLTRSAAVAAAGVVLLADGPAWIVYLLAGVIAVLATAYTPAESALLPAISRTPEELTAANVTASTIDSVGSFVGPAIAGVLLATTDVGVVFFVTAGTFLWSAFLISTIRGAGASETVGKEERGGFAREAVAGFRAIALEKRLRILVALYAAQTMVAGALSVLVVVTAFDLLDQGESGVGLLNAAAGVGGLVGALVAFALVGRKRLAADFGLGIVLWGAPLALIGIWPNTTVALVMLGLLGLGNTLVDISGLTLLQRAAPPEVIARVFGVLESMLVGAIGLGAVITPLLIDWLGSRTTLIVIGAFLPVLAALTWRRLVAIDAEVHAPPELELLQGVPIFAALHGPALERLAAHLVPVHAKAGSEVIRQGDRGDRFYVVGEGELEVLVDGRPTRTVLRGDFFGEIALLRDIPRTATVRALTDVSLHALERDDFLAAVTEHPPSARAADAVIGARLGTAPA